MVESAKMTEKRNRFVSYLGIFLAISYGLGGPITLYLELKESLFSTRFDFPTWLIISGCLIQFISAMAILFKPTARLAAICLTLTTIGAIFAHVRIGSPFTAIPAIVYTGLQILFIINSKSR